MVMQYVQDKLFSPHRTNELCCPPVVAEELVVVEAPHAMRARRLESIF